MAKYMIVELAEDNKKTAGGGCLTVIVLIIWAIVSIKDCISEKIDTYQQESAVEKTVEEVNALKNSKEKLTLEQCQIYINCDMTCEIGKIGDESKVIHESKGYPCSDKFKNSLDKSVLLFCYNLIKEKCECKYSYCKNCKDPISGSDYDWSGAEEKYESAEYKEYADQAKVEEELRRLNEQKQQLLSNGAVTADSKLPTPKTDKTAKSGAGGTDKAGDTSAPVGKKADKAKVIAALKDANAKAKKCGVGGSLTVQFNLSNNTAKGVKAIGGTFAGSATEKCILTVVQKYSWPEGTASDIKYTFKF